MKTVCQVGCIHSDGFHSNDPPPWHMWTLNVYDNWQIPLFDIIEVINAINGLPIGKKLSINYFHLITWQEALNLIDSEHKIFLPECKELIYPTSVNNASSYQWFITEDGIWDLMRHINDDNITHCLRKEMSNILKEAKDEWANSGIREFHQQKQHTNFNRYRYLRSFRNFYFCGIQYAEGPEIT